MKAYFLQPTKNGSLRFGLENKKGRRLRFDTCVDMIELLCKAGAKVKLPKSLSKRGFKAGL